MEFRQIRYALAVARERSFTNASLRLNVSQSAISEQVKLLEDEIGFSLFRRTRRGAELTPRGRHFLTESERVASEFGNLADIARELRGGLDESLSIGISSGLAPILIPRMFADNSLPADLHLEIRTAPTRVIFDELHKDKLDLGIVADVGPELVPPTLVATALFQMEMALIFPPKHRFAGAQGPIGIPALIDEPIIMNELSIGYGEIVSAMFRDVNKHPHIKAIVDNVETVKVMVQAGVGLAIIPSGAAELEQSLGLLKLRPIANASRVNMNAYFSRQSLPRRKRELVEQLCDSTRVSIP